MSFRIDTTNGDEVAVVDSVLIELSVWGDCSNGAYESVTAKLTPKEARQIGRALRVYGELYDIES